MTRIANAAPNLRPRLLLLVLGIVVAGSAAAILAVNPGGMSDHQALTNLSVPAIIGAGFLDGFNPCAFGVLILFATFALGLAAQQSLAATESGGRPDVRGASRTVLGLGSIFVLGVLVTYFLIGLGLMTAVASLTNFGGNHLPTRIAALIAIGLGLWMVRDVLLRSRISVATTCRPGSRPSLRSGSACGWSAMSSFLMPAGGSRRRTRSMAGCGPGRAPVPRSRCSAVAS